MKAAYRIADNVAILLLAVNVMLKSAILHDVASIWLMTILIILQIMLIAFKLLYESGNT